MFPQPSGEHLVRVLGGCREKRGTLNGEGLSKQGAGAVGAFSKAGYLAVPSRGPVLRAVHGIQVGQAGVQGGQRVWRMQDPGQRRGEGRQRGQAMGFLPSCCPVPGPPGVLEKRILGLPPTKSSPTLPHTRSHEAIALHCLSSRPYWQQDHQ